jgi:ABC-type arginine transport system permease subunit
VDKLDALREIARDALRAEFMTPAGVVNLLGLLAALILVIAVGASDLFQAVIRTFESGYSTGLPSVVVLLILYFAAMLLCVIILGLLARPRNR